MVVVAVILLHTKIIVIVIFISIFFTLYSYANRTKKIRRRSLRAETRTLARAKEKFIVRRIHASNLIDADIGRKSNSKYG